MMYYYKQVIDGEIISVEAKSVNVKSPGFIGTTKVEYDNFLASRPPKPQPEPTRDLAAEIDELKAKVEKLET